MANPGTSSGVEASAVKIITRAIELEGTGRLQPALTCYQEGIDLLLEVLKCCQNQEKKLRLRGKLEEYMTRAEKVKSLVNKQKAEGKYHEQLHIKDDDTRHGYKEIFGPYLDDTVREVFIEDAYIRNIHQVHNFLQFCELLVNQCKNLKKIHLTTSEENNQNSQQIQNLRSIQNSLSQRNISLSLTFSPSLHDREIRFDNGWIIKVGRGLDYFKRSEKFSIGFHDLSLRSCHATTVDVFHSSHTKSREL